MAKRMWPKELLDAIKLVTAKRPKTVIDHILEHGDVTTEELERLYGYKHAPRAARDVREQGIPLITTRVTRGGRTMASYTFGDLSEIKSGKIGGRQAWPKEFKNRLVDLYGSRCGVCLAEYESRYLQIDHRVPYEVAGDDSSNLRLDEFMLLCGSCNRAKSWSCEHCLNWTKDHKVKVCMTCYWANPSDYLHIALRKIRRVDIVWTENEVTDHDNLLKQAEKDGISLPESIKKRLRNG